MVPGPTWSLCGAYAWAHNSSIAFTQDLIVEETYVPADAFGDLMVLHSPTGVSTGVPRKPKNFPYFQICFWYFRDLGSNIKVVNQNNLIFKLLQQK